MTSVVTQPRHLRDEIEVLPDLDPSKRRRIRSLWPLALVIAFQVAYLWPTLRTGWMFDDSLNYNIRAALSYEHQSYWQNSINDISSWWNAGRFFPLLSFIGYGTFYLFQDRFEYKLLLIAYTVLASCALWALMRRLGLNRATAALGILFATVTIQFRDYHDALISYQGFIQLLIIEMCVSLICFDKWLETKQRRYLLASVFLFAAACGMYELGYSLCLFFVPVALRRRSDLKRVTIGLAPIFAIAFGFCALALTLRAITSNPYQGYQPNYNASVVMHTFAKQEFGTLPGSFVHHLRYPQLTSLHAFISDMTPGALLIGVLAGITAAILSFAARKDSQTKRGPWPLALLGALFLVIPAIPIAVAPKYQMELQKGWAYLPVLIQIFGLGVIVAVVHQLVRTRVMRTGALTVVLALVVGVGVAGVGAYDRRSNELTVNDLSWTRTTMNAQQQLLQHGVLNGVPEMSRIYTSSGSWLNKYFFYRFTNGRRFDVRIETPAVIALEPHDPSACANNPKAVYIFNTTPLNLFKGNLTPSLTCLGPLTNPVG